MNKGLVSIITPSYNGEKYLEKYFDAFLNQTYSKLEIIFVDDGSTDNTKVKIEEYKKMLEKKNIKLIYIYQENKGQAEAVNNDLKSVTGEFLYWMDVDDFCEYDTMQNMVKFLNENKDYNIVRGKVRILENNKEIEIREPKENESEYIFENYVFEKNSYCFPGIFMVRTCEFDKNVKNRSIYNSRAGQNWQLILPNTYGQKCGFINKVVYNYNIIPNSHSHKKITLKQEINKTFEHEDILIKVINSIVKIDQKYKKKLFNRIKRKYQIKRIKLVINKIKNKMKEKIKK